MIKRESYTKRREVLDDLVHLKNCVNNVLYDLDRKHGTTAEVLDLKHVSSYLEEMSERLRKLWFDKDGAKNKVQGNKIRRFAEGNLDKDGA